MKTIRWGYQYNLRITKTNGNVMLLPTGVEIVPVPSPLLLMLQAASTCGSDQNGSDQPRQQTTAHTKT